MRPERETSQPTSELASRRATQAVLAVGGAVLLASLYLPWLKPSNSGVTGLLNLFPGGLTIDGWSTQLGAAAALADLFLFVVALAALAPARFATRLPLSEAALLAFYLAVAVGVDARATANLYKQGFSGVHFHYAYGAYLGTASAVVVLLACVATWEASPFRGLLGQVVASVLTFTLLVALLLPWFRAPLVARSIEARGLVTSPVVVAAAAAVWLFVGLWSSWFTPTARVALAGSAALFAGAGLSLPSTAGTSYLYGAWLALASSLALVAVTFTTDVRRMRLPRPGGRDVAVGAASALLIASLFLPWQTARSSSSLVPGLSREMSVDGWTLLGTGAAVFAVILVVSTGHRRRLFEPVMAIAVLVATAGFELFDVAAPGVRYDISYGAKVGFAAAALLVALLLAGSRPARIGRPLVVAPVAACVGYVTLVTLPWWDVLPAAAQQDLRFAAPSWLTVAGVLLALALAHAWARSERDWLVVLPAAMLALAAIVLFEARDEGLEWGGGIVVGLSVLLIVLGAVERAGGLESFRVPEILRVDRL